MAGRQVQIADVTDEAAQDAALRALAAGRLVVVPTETVYGLAADATRDDAVLKIYEAKDRPRFNPLIAHCSDLAMAERFGVFDDRARRLARAFWPGPLTLVVPRRPGCGISELVTAGHSTIALRIPGLDPVRRLIARLDRPLAAPSANRSGRISPTTAEAAASEVGDRVALVLDGGPCGVGVESTIVACLDDSAVLLRPGGVPRGAIEEALGENLRRPEQVTDDESPRAPGMLSSHYAPRAKVRLHAAGPAEGEAYLAFGQTPAGARPGFTRNLSASGDLREAAINLFAHLRALDATGAPTIAVAPVPDQGLGEAINDRLRRAAAPR
ncbi:L-threonylcarbamoyladenylate synthase [Lutibaculum baratangense]|uniref:Threonylcarbamoyl-AMP synthase n=1 Tax=Lutibaculum baratangense AMV1 TaxID=631454 RepID=V4RHB8_9HYPH|nr:L-threonylcarbamoyladenylate synthase [Lutibaculum baratangense]ESR24754.1 YrdC/Sua5 family protein, required for threonylcarbamoyladenosine (t(6)A) formation in tRNA [Lutibaculum baratangense AMV1]